MHELIANPKTKPRRNGGKLKHILLVENNQVVSSTLRTKNRVAQRVYQILFNNLRMLLGLI